MKVQLLPGAPWRTRPTAESVGLNPIQSEFESQVRHHPGLDQLAESMVLEAIQSGFESQSRDHFES